MIRRPPRSTLFPSPTLFRSQLRAQGGAERDHAAHEVRAGGAERAGEDAPAALADDHHTLPGRPGQRLQPLDRKSTRLNSSHANISYAVFCLKKKKNKTNTPP